MICSAIWHSYQHLNVNKTIETAGGHFHYGYSPLTLDFRTTFCQKMLYYVSDLQLKMMDLFEKEEFIANIKMTENQLKCVNL